MELMETSLERLLYNEYGKPLPVALVLHIGIQIARALSYLHPTILHRDLKPANVLISQPDSDKPVAKLAAPYMAPETFDALNRTVTDRSDIYSLGVILWEMLAGTRPWEGETMVRIAFSITIGCSSLPLDAIPPHRCPPKLRALIWSCWESDPARRPAAAEVVKALALIQEPPHYCVQQQNCLTHGWMDGPPPPPPPPLQCVLLIQVHNDDGVDTVDGAAQPGGSTQSPADAARAAALAIRQKEVQEAMRNDTHKKVEAVSVDVVKLHATLAETVANQADVNGKVTSALEDLRATVLRLETFMMAEKAKGNANDPRLNRLKDIAIHCLKSPLAALGKDKVAATVVELAAAESINPPTSVEKVLAHWAEIEDDATYKAVTSGAGASNANTPLKTPRQGEGDKSQGGMASFKKPRTDGKGDSKLAPNQCRICRAFKKPSETWSDHKAECIKNQRSALDKKMAHLARLENQMEE
ncbi:hypothetical protein PLESTF_000755500 [Pleodorina starrii]|nr:hypothetical protein PLESTF_000755500 [Pleodorina starrii]